MMMPTPSAAASFGAQLRRLVAAHQAAAARLAAADARVRRARAEAREAVAARLQELRDELDAW